MNMCTEWFKALGRNNSSIADEHNGNTLLQRSRRYVYLKIYDDMHSRPFIDREGIWIWCFVSFALVVTFILFSAKIQNLLWNVVFVYINQGCPFSTRCPHRHPSHPYSIYFVWCNSKQVCAQTSELWFWSIDGCLPLSQPSECQSASIDWHSCSLTTSSNINVKHITCVLKGKKIC